MQLERGNILTFRDPFRRKMHVNPSISHSISEAEAEDLCRVKFEYKYVGGAYLASLKPQVTCLFFQLSSKIKSAGEDSWFLFYSSISTGISLTTGSF